jgi:outer membrane beta-barrel protein
MRVTWLPLLLAPLLLLPGARAARADADEPALSPGSVELPAVQNRLYRLEHEFIAGVGVLPVDAFYKGLTFSGGYVWHPTQLWGLEARFSYSYNFKTGLRDRIEGNFPVDSDRFTELTYIGEISGLLKPFYGKLSALNRTLLYGEIYFSVSAVVGVLEGGEDPDDRTTALGTRMAFGAAPGFGLRGFINKHLSLRVDFRYLLLVAENGEGHFPLMLSLSLGASTRSDR